MSSMSLTWTTACPDWATRIVSKQSLMPCKPLFPKVADVAERIFKELILVDVMGSPKMGDVTLEWVIEFVRAIFGAYDPSTKRRLIREFFLLISKKNTKSTIAAGIMLTALILNDRQSAELIILAPTKEVADNSFNPIRDFIRADEELSERFNVSEHTKTVTHLGTGATLKVIAAESNAAAGKKASIILIDEVWLFGKRANAESMFREAKGGLASRPEGCVIYLSTMSDEVPCGVFKQLLDYARDVRDGIKVDKSFLPLIYEFPKHLVEAGEHLKPENFYITNPNLGASVDLEYLISEFNKVKDAGEESLRDFLAKHLNIEIGMNLRANRWAGAEFWLQQSKKFTLNKLIDQSDVITIGIDGGGLDDLLGFAVLGRHKDSRKWWLWNHAWCNTTAVERRKENAPKYQDCVQEGSLTIVERIGDDIDQLAKIAKQVFDSGKLNKIGLDPLGLGGLLDGLLKVGIPEEQMIAVPQGFKLMGYILTTERKLAEGNLYHQGSQLMTWCVGNARAVVKGNGMMISKQESGVGKIDPLIATFNAVALMSVNPEPKNFDIDGYLEDVVIA
ncbi:TPA: terminase large subunit [Acinetobacter baumannii]|uniref:terminase large subunit n=1 Tax=Acinetobacter calcoaceticus/baumannii complex TaxID=909768 RepID=UPI000A33ED1C|nr:MULTISPECIES: terminase TerL endonuclease subunit [Acinetobacter calcoaceticus/baumannii complex]MCG9521232.1 terminase large subunit [Acinetobacter pittii]OTL01329.1 terminase [Acinetobacter nosocomialis]QLB35725.1 terminase large subunit [Acinetobacter baumannii]QNX16546.1 terminase large subunit [Acinetobacter seifertii]HAV5624365.1 terminase large subunit [Acinetobacter baumannii]